MHLNQHTGYEMYTVTVLRTVEQGVSKNEKDIPAE